MDLSVKVVENLILSDPFMIASSHWTENERIFRQLAPFKPSAVTLKTTSNERGGNGVDPDGRRREKRPLIDSFGKHFAVYTDGPQKVELWDIATTFEKTKEAKEILGDSIIGLSILQGEDYADIKNSLNISDYGYVELNLKYSLREIPYEYISKSLASLNNDIKEFLCIFKGIPVFIKLPREIAHIIDTRDFLEILKSINSANGGVIIANSLRRRIPPSRSGLVSPKELSDGVLVGEHLYLETFHLIRSLTLRSDNRTAIIPPIVGSGGVSDIQGFIDLIAAGAKCVQVCTLLDIYGPHIIDLFRNQIHKLSQQYGSFQAFADAIRSDSSSWNMTVKKSQSFIMDNNKFINKVFRDNAPYILDTFKEALLIECGKMTTPTKDAEDRKVEEGLRIVGSRGNISSFLFVNRCVQKYNFELLELKSWSQLSNKNILWDLAIVPKHVVDLSKKWLIEIGIVSRSVYELLGLGPMPLSDIEYIYYFGGSSSSRHVIAELLRRHKPQKLEDITQGGYRLLPSTLQFWKERHAILAKPPLSRIIGLFCPKDDMINWKCLWRSEEPLVLVVSSRYHDKGKESYKAAREVLRFIERERAKIVKNPLPSISFLKQWGFINYCRSWLGSNEEYFL